MTYFTGPSCADSTRKADVQEAKRALMHILIHRSSHCQIFTRLDFASNLGIRVIVNKVNFARMPTKEQNFARSREAHLFQSSPTMQRARQRQLLSQLYSKFVWQMDLVLQLPFKCNVLCVARPAAILVRIARTQKYLYKHSSKPKRTTCWLRGA